MVKCYDFFGLDHDFSLISDLNIPAEGFELLLDVVDLIGYNDQTIKLIIKNMPEEYSLKNSPKNCWKKCSKWKLNIK